MPNQHQVITEEQEVGILAGVALGEPQRAVAARNGVSKTAVQQHGAGERGGFEPGERDRLQKRIFDRLDPIISERLKVLEAETKPKSPMVAAGIFLDKQIKLLQGGGGTTVNLAVGISTAMQAQSHLQADLLDLTRPLDDGAMQRLIQLAVREREALNAEVAK